MIKSQDTICTYQERYRASRKRTQNSGLYTGGLTDSVLFPNYSRLINHLPGSHPVYYHRHTAAIHFLPSPHNRFATPGPTAASLPYPLF